MDGSSPSTVSSRSLRMVCRVSPVGTGGERPLGEGVGGSEAAVLVHQQFADAGAGVGERAQGVEWLGEGERGLQGAAGGGPFVGGDRERGFQQPGVDQGVREQRGRGAVEDRAQERRGRGRGGRRPSAQARMSSSSALSSVRRSASPGRFGPRRRARAAGRRGTRARRPRRPVRRRGGGRRTRSGPAAARPARLPGRRGRRRRRRGRPAGRTAAVGSARGTARRARRRRGVGPRRASARRSAA